MQHFSLHVILSFLVKSNVFLNPVFHLCYILLKIKFRNRSTADPFKNCNISVDGTDVPIFEPAPFVSRWYSFKLNGPGLRYEVALDITRKKIHGLTGLFFQVHLLI